jgi:DNA-binding CsgD family transcriptional regulator
MGAPFVSSFMGREAVPSRFYVATSGDAADIAAQLHLSAGTVRNYLSEAIGKLGAANRVEAYRLARQKGWL